MARGGRVRVMCRRIRAWDRGRVVALGIAGVRSAVDRGVAVERFSQTASRDADAVVLADDRGEVPER